ncbi:unnamed protein product [Choristocarpus tenellus]
MSDEDESLIEEWQGRGHEAIRMRLMADVELCPQSVKASADTTKSDAGSTTDETGESRSHSSSSDSESIIDVESMDVTTAMLSTTYTAAISASGITGDVVFGSVRSKRLAEGLTRITSMTDLSKAVDEAVSQSMAGGERTNRANSASLEEFSSGTAKNCYGSCKRARSGAYRMSDAAVVPESSVGIIGQERNTRLDAMAPKELGVGGIGSVAEKFRSEAGSEMSRGKVGESVAASGLKSVIEGGAKGGGAERSEMTKGVVKRGEVKTNEEYLAALMPLLACVPDKVHPEDYLHGILKERGYSTEMVPSLETPYHQPPTAYQVTAYGKDIVQAVLGEDVETLSAMRTSGRSMCACNRFGDSILHMACRRGRVRSLRYLLGECGEGTELSDDCGRTLLHDACWTAEPRFDIASTVLDKDLRLLRILDKRGSSPLQYVPQEHWRLWCAFFESRKEIYWAPLGEGCPDVAGTIPRLKPVPRTTPPAGSVSSVDIIQG